MRDQAQPLPATAGGRRSRRRGRRERDGLLIIDPRARRLSGAIVAVMLVCLAAVIILTVLSTALDGLIGGSVPWAWVAGVGLWVLSVVLCELYIGNTRHSSDVGGSDDE